MTAAELNVVISATDNASGVIAGVASQLAGLEGASASAAGGTASMNAALTGTARSGKIADSAVLKGTQRLEAYKRQMSAAKTTLAESSAALAVSRREYDANKKSISGNIGMLTREQQSLGTVIAAKRNEISALKQANSVINKGSVAYKDNQKAIEWTENELAALETRYGNISNSIQSAQNTLTASRLNFESSGAAVKAASEQYESYEKNLEAVERLAKAENLQDAGSRIQAVGESIDTITKPLQYAAVGIAGLGVASGKTAISFEDNFARVKKTVEGTPEQLEAVKQGLIDLTTTGVNGRNPVRATTAELTELAAAGGQLGIKTENIVEFTETMAQMQSATNLGGEAGAKALARFMNVANVSQDQVKNLGSAIVDLGNNFATSEAEIVDMALDMGSTGATVGISAQAVLGYATALSSMGIEAAAGGSALQRIWMDMQNAVSSGGEELEAFAKLSGKSADEFKKSWGKDADGAFRDFLKGLNESEDQVGVLNELGFNNVRDQRALLALAGEKGFGVLTEAIERSNKAWSENTALQKEADAMTQTTAGQMEIAKHNITEAARSFGEVLLPTVVDVSQGVSKFAQGLAGMSDEEKKAVVNTGAVVVGLGAAAKVTSKVVKGVGKTKEVFGGLAEKIAEKGGMSGILGGGAGFAAGIGLLSGGIWAALMANAEKTTKVDEKFGESVNGVGKEFKAFNDQVWESNQRLSEYADITDKINSGKLKGDEKTAALERQAELQEWITDNYGDYITLSERENGVTEKGIAAIRKRNDLELERQQLEYEASLIGAQEEYSNSEKRIGEIKESLAENNADRDAALARADAYREYGNALLDLENQEKQGIITSKEKKAAMADLRKEYGFMEESSDAAYSRAEREQNQADNRLKEINRLSSEMNDLKTQQNEAQTAALDLASVYADKLPDAIKAADGSADRMISTLIQTTRGLGVDNEIAQQIALAKNGVEDLQSAQDHGKLGSVVKDYAELGEQFGMTASEIAAGQSLIQNGFTNVYDALLKGPQAFDAVQIQFKDLGVQANAASEDLTDAAHKFNLIGEDQKLERATAGGKEFVKTIDEAGSVIEAFNKTDGIDVKINGSGGVDIVNTLGETIQSLQDLGATELKINVDTGGIDVYGKDGLLGSLGLDEEGNYTIKINKEDGEDNTTEPDDAEQNVDKVDGADNTTDPDNAEQNVDKVDGADNTTDPDNAEQNVDKVDGEDNTTDPSDEPKTQPVDKVDGEDNTTDPKPVEVPIKPTWGAGGGSGKNLSDVLGVGTNPINGNSVDITTNVNIKPGTINVEALSSAVSTATQLISAVGTNPIAGNSVDITTSVNITAGTINVEALTGAVSSAMQIVSSFGTQPVNITASVTVTAGTINVAALTGAVSTAMQIVSAATTNNINATANVTVTAGTVDTSAISAAVASSVANIADASAAVNITVTGTITYTADYGGIGNAPELASAVIYSADFGGIGAAPELSGIVHYSADFSGIGSAPTLTGTVVYTAKFSKQATGTDYFGGGLAMVNDQRGVADPRELVVDHGRAFIPEGRDVVLPLSKGAKVYTASQTKAIMAGIGIPHYAEGKENSDAFTAAKDSWTHYTKIHAVTTSEELEKWIELSKEFVDNEKDAADIAEEIYSLQREINEELNDRSAAWIDDRTALNDWEEYGDTAIAAFDRVRARNLEEFEAGRLTWEEYTDIISDLGADMYNAQIEQSKNWLEHEEKYRGMSEDDYIAGLDRMAAYTQEYYEQGIINHREYIEGIAEINDEKIDTLRDQLDEQMKQSDAWFDERSYFNDWADYGDDPITAFNRVRDRINADVAAGIITWEEGQEKLKEFGEQAYDYRKDNSLDWTDEQLKYYAMDNDGYFAALDRREAYTRDYYANGIIDFRKFNEEMKEIDHDRWDAAAEAYDDMLDTQSEYIRELEKKFSDQESELRASWEVEDRAVDMADLEHQLAIFEGAVTDKGQEHYKDLLEQYKDAQREEELYQLEVRNNAVIEDLQAEYDELENAKVDFIKGIAENTDIDVGGYVREITTNISRSSDNTLRTLQEIITAIKSLDFKMEQQNFSDNRTVTIYSVDRYDVEYMAGLGG